MTKLLTKEKTDTKHTTFGTGEHAYTVPFDINSEEYVVTIEELNEGFQRFIREEYGIEDCDIQVKMNGRLSSTLGSYVLKYDANGNEVPDYIEISKTLMRIGSEDFIWDTLYHEAIHYACHVTGLQYRDGQDDFENELRRHGVGSTQEGGHVGLSMEFECGDCGGSAESYKKRIWNNYNNAHSLCCKSKLKPIALRVYDGSGDEPIRYMATMKGGN